MQACFVMSGLTQSQFKGVVAHPLTVHLDRTILNSFHYQLMLMFLLHITVLQLDLWLYTLIGFIYVMVDLVELPFRLGCYFCS
jgi:hypothetical protein